MANSKIGSKRRRIAFHEAAHAVTARVLGAEVDAVMMFHTDEATPASTFSSSFAYRADKASAASRIAGFEKDTMVSLAGPAGDRLYSRDRTQTKGMRDGATDDIARAHNYVVL